MLSPRTWQLRGIKTWPSEDEEECVTMDMDLRIAGCDPNVVVVLELVRKRETSPVLRIRTHPPAACWAAAPTALPNAAAHPTPPPCRSLEGV